MQTWTHEVPINLPAPSSAATPVKGFAEAQAAAGDGGKQKPKPQSQTSPDGVPSQADVAAASAVSPTLAPAKPLNTTAAVNVANLPNGYWIAAVNGYPGVANAKYMHPNVRHNGLTIQQMQSMSALLPNQDVNNVAFRQPGAYMMSNPAYLVQMAGARPMQWSVASQRSRESAAIADTMSMLMGSGSPVRAPSADGVHTHQLVQSVLMATAGHVLNRAQGRASPAGLHVARLAPHSLSPHMLSPNMTASQVNIKLCPTCALQPAILTPSPPLQTRKIAGGSGVAGRPLSSHAMDYHSTVLPYSVSDMFVN